MIWQCLSPRLLIVSLLASLVIVAIHPRSVMHRSGPGSTDKINAQKDAHASLKTLIGNGAHTLGSVSDFTSGCSSALLRRSTGSRSDDADIIGITKYCANKLGHPLRCHLSPRLVYPPRLMNSDVQHPRKRQFERKMTRSGIYDCTL